MEAQMQETWNEDEAILHSLQDDIVVTDVNGIILKASKATGEIYGVDYTELLGKSVYALEEQGLFTPILTPKVVQDRKKVTLIQKTAQGNKLLVTGIPVFDNRGELVRIVSYSHDVTELMRLKEYLKTMEEDMRRVKSELDWLRHKHVHIVDGIIAQSRAMKMTLDVAMRAAETDANVLILGESGVGKSHLAKFIHSRSSRCNGPFIEVNCGAIPESLFEAEFFGYEPGAFTGANRKGKVGLAELAAGGTLFLDEVAELTPTHQIKLLNFIQDKQFYRVGGTARRQVDVRFIAATNQNISEMIINGRFRQDLYFRLNVIPITIPPLRERAEDIPPLIEHFLGVFTKKHRRSREFDRSALECLTSHSWRGNVRELMNVIEQLVVISPLPIIEMEHLPSHIRNSLPVYCENMYGTLPDILDRVEKQVLLEARRKYRTMVEIARALGISQPSVTRKLKKHNIR
ncbi:sigma-54 interaction domain-containing protein [Alicyclobacillus kakegawensis]|uniref:sigma-54 interaction domain-containing protein n=1 Tax=Alicyclobacillus kakegawensis TaxID=392012 RepID=UPI000AA5B8B3|nr:sigma 54-interacting transcriptional regulator [Alicyclobacillus kakegawensis]